VKRRNSLQALLAISFPQVLVACSGGSGGSLTPAPVVAGSGSGSNSVPTPPAATASISAFNADKAEYPKGLYPTLTATYTGASGTIDPGAVTIQSGTSVRLAAPLLATQTAKLTVKSSTETATKDLQLKVVSGVPKWRTALDRANAGGARATIACVGDSTTSGLGANILSATDDSRAKAYPAQLAKVLFSKFGIKADANSIWGDGNAPDISLFDPRISLATGWAISDTFIAGGKAFINRSDSSGALSFKPSFPTDTLDVYYVVQPGYGTVEVSTADVVNLAAQTAGAGGVGKLTVKRTLGAVTWDIRKAVGTGPIMIAGIDAYDSAASNVSVWNMGCSGSDIATWMGGQFSAVCPTLAPDLTIICLTINDWLAATPGEAYNMGIQALIDAAKKTGDVLLMVGAPTRNGEAARVAIQKVYADYIRVLASKNNLPLVDMIYNWKSQESLWDKGYYFDGMHPSAQGYLDIAITIGDFIGEP
jgi:lysophospholipase L1-like esterase